MREWPRRKRLPEVLAAVGNGEVAAGDPCTSWGSVYYTRLGDDGDGEITEPVIQDHGLAKFKQALLKIEEEINERNKTRTPYEFLFPSRIPQSINIWSRCMMKLVAIK